MSPALARYFDLLHELLRLRTVNRAVLTVEREAHFDELLANAWRELTADEQDVVIIYQLSQ